MKFILFFKIKKLNREISYLNNVYDLIVDNSVRNIEEETYHDSKTLSYIKENKQKVMFERSIEAVNKLQYLKNTIDELKYLIAGAFGENLVEKEIKKLSDDYILINDFNLKFKSPIFDKKTNDKIYSIQIDHLLISKAGLFILETKNWSQKSIDSFDLRSPVDQIIRTNYALFIVINNQTNLIHHWGDKKIPIRNVIVMIHSKPKEEFKYVKVKLLKDLNKYIEYFEEIFSKSEVEEIKNQLIKISN